MFGYSSSEEDSDESDEVVPKNSQSLFGSTVNEEDSDTEIDFEKNSTQGEEIQVLCCGEEKIFVINVSNKKVIFSMNQLEECSKCLLLKKFEGWKNHLVAFGKSSRVFVFNFENIFRLYNFENGKKKYSEKKIKSSLNISSIIVQKGFKCSSVLELPEKLLLGGSNHLLQEKVDCCHVMVVDKNLKEEKRIIISELEYEEVVCMIEISSHEIALGIGEFIVIMDSKDFSIKRRIKTYENINCMMKLDEKRLYVGFTRGARTILIDIYSEEKEVETYFFNDLALSCNAVGCSTDKNELYYLNEANIQSRFSKIHVFSLKNKSKRPYDPKLSFWVHSELGKEYMDGTYQCSILGLPRKQALVGYCTCNSLLEGLILWNIKTKSIIHRFDVRSSVEQIQIFNGFVKNTFSFQKEIKENKNYADCSVKTKQ